MYNDISKYQKLANKWHYSAYQRVTKEYDLSPSELAYALIPNKLKRELKENKNRKIRARFCFALNSMVKNPKNQHKQLEDLLSKRCRPVLLKSYEYTELDLISERGGGGHHHR